MIKFKGAKNSQKNWNMKPTSIVDIPRYENNFRIYRFYPVADFFMV